VGIGRGLAIASTLVVLLAGLAACDHVCPTGGCLPGLVVGFDDSFTPGQTFDLTLSEVTATSELVAFMSCTYSPGGGADGGAFVAPLLTCDSALPHNELGTVILIGSYPSQKIDIKVSSGATTLADKTFDVVFKTSTPNGPACGTCTQAAVTMSLR
jgi:hypothetical protein